MILTRRQPSENVHIYEYTGALAPFKQVFTADGHVDNPDTARGAFLNVLDYCLQNQIIWHHIGDLIDVMQGKSDRRSSKSKIDPALKRGDYMNGLIDMFTEMLAPYANILGSITYGNHETIVIDKLEIDLLKLIIRRLQTEHNSPVMLGEYSGWIVNRWIKDDRKVNLASHKTFYRHSGGSYGEVSKGVLGVGRMQGMQEGANMIVSGDNHESWLVNDGVTYLDKQFVIRNKTVPHVKIPTFKDEFKQGQNSYHVIKNRKYKPTGLVEVTFTPYRDRANGDAYYIEAEPQLLSLRKFT